MATSAAGTAGPVELHEPWSISDIWWDAEACTGLLAPASTPAGAPLLPRPPPAGYGGSGGAQVPATRAQPSALLPPPAEREARCQVVGCEAPLRDLGRYYVRNRLCPVHLRSVEVTIASGAVVRFCQVSAACDRLALPRPAAAAGAGRAVRRGAARRAHGR